MIIVEPGNYTENVIISTQNLTIKSKSENPENTIITANSPNINVLHIQANNTTISGFKVQSAQYAEVAGIYLAGCNYCTISNDDLSENSFGLYLSNSNNNLIADNKMNFNKKYGIQLMHSKENILSNNSADSNHHGVILENNCSDNNLTGNTIGLNAGYGFYLINSSNNNLNNNTISRNDMGIYLTNSNLSIISGNNISENIRYGMWISYSNYGIFSGNTISKSNWGIHMNSSDKCTISGNILISNRVSGLSMCPACDNNTIFNNYLNNTFNADIGNRKNTWSIVKKAGINIVGGPYIGGNFWASPEGTGFSQTAPDIDKNGIADIKYNETNITDSLPIVPVFSLQLTSPVANLSTELRKPNTVPTDSSIDLTNLSTNLTDTTLSKTTDILVSENSNSDDDNVIEAADGKREFS